LLASDLLANDDGAVSISSVQNSDYGTVSLDGDGNVVFTPVADYYGPAVFSYTAQDGNGNSSTATVTLDVRATLDESHLISKEWGTLAEPDMWDAAQLDNGGHVTVWHESDFVYLMITRADGTTQRSRSGLSGLTNHVTELKVEGLAGGGFVVMETTSAYSPSRTGFVVYNASGNMIGRHQMVTVEGTWQNSPEIIGLQDGGFVLLFSERPAGRTDYDTYGRRYSATGEALGERFEISGDDRSTETQVNGVELADGRLAVFSMSQYGGTYTTTLQVLSSRGVKLGDSIVALEGEGRYQQFKPSAMLLADGRVAVAIGTARLQVYNIDANNAVTLDATVDIDAGNMVAQIVTFSDIVALADGGMFVAFTRGERGGFTRIYGQRYDAAGNPVHGEVDFGDLAYGSEQNIRLEPASDGGVYLYYSNENASGKNDLYRIHVDAGVTGETLADAQYLDVPGAYADA
ncbi:Ig-like domain-containing protein, partial [Thalassospira profundimaris]|uniref:Ig-like domain-containing protein n=1 Tax=Thalassospira profundimaris TaxID=502049 RepID=UPI0015F05DAE